MLVSSFLYKFVCSSAPKNCTSDNKIVTNFFIRVLNRYNIERDLMEKLVSIEYINDINDKSRTINRIRLMIKLIIYKY